MPFFFSLFAIVIELYTLMVRFDSLMNILLIEVCYADVHLNRKNIAKTFVNCWEVLFFRNCYVVGGCV